LTSTINNPTKQKILFVCGRGKKRSPTAASIFRKDPNLSIRFGGISKQSKHQISKDDVLWADVIFVMEAKHKDWIIDNFRGLKLPRIEILDIADEYEYMDEELVELLIERVGIDLE
jgi:protein-tyrosine phosphatase